MKFIPNVEDKISQAVQVYIDEFKELPDGISLNPEDYKKLADIRRCKVSDVGGFILPCITTNKKWVMLTVFPEDGIVKGDYTTFFVNIPPHQLQIISTKEDVVEEPKVIIY